MDEASAYWSWGPVEEPLKLIGGTSPATRARKPDTHPLRCECESCRLRREFYQHQFRATRDPARPYTRGLTPEPSEHRRGRWRYRTDNRTVLTDEERARHLPSGLTSQFDTAESAALGSYLRSILTDDHGTLAAHRAHGMRSIGVIVPSPIPCRCGLCVAASWERLDRLLEFPTGSRTVLLPEMPSIGEGVLLSAPVKRAIRADERETSRRASPDDMYDYGLNGFWSEWPAGKRLNRDDNRRPFLFFDPDTIERALPKFDWSPSRLVGDDGLLSERARDAETGEVDRWHSFCDPDASGWWHFYCQASHRGQYPSDRALMDFKRDWLSTWSHLTGLRDDPGFGAYLNDKHRPDSPIFQAGCRRSGCRCADRAPINGGRRVVVGPNAQREWRAAVRGESDFKATEAAKESSGDDEESDPWTPLDYGSYQRGRSPAPSTWRDLAAEYGEPNPPDLWAAVAVRALELFISSNRPRWHGIRAQVTREFPNIPRRTVFRYIDNLENHTVDWSSTRARLVIRAIMAGPKKRMWWKRA